MDFRISALNLARFKHLFGQDSRALEDQGVQRRIVDSNFGFPCRISLRDAEVGESVLLINYEHLPLSTPYRSAHAIFVREKASQAAPDINEIPDMFLSRLLSVRTFDESGMMVDADVICGKQLKNTIELMLVKEPAKFLHIHNAKTGCYLALATMV